MASVSKNLMTGVLTVSVFVLAIGGLVAFGAGVFDDNEEADTRGGASQAAPSGGSCPSTGYSTECSDKTGEKAGLMQVGGAGLPSEECGGCPSMKAGSMAATAATSS